MPMETNDSWMMPFQEGDGYPSYLVIDSSSGMITLQPYPLRAKVKAGVISREWYVRVHAM